ncbi:MAG TPA: SRPBCC family protein [Ktedonobacteraceae bacterium]|nr:SRPBCC family protein [Ktedonobacteraceae bacterium]
MIPIEIKQHVSISLPIADTFAYMSNLENLAEWSSFIMTAHKTSPEEMQVGTVLQSTIRFLGHRSNVTFEVIEHEPNHFLTMKSIAGVAPCLVYYRFGPDCDGGTNFSQEVVIYITENMSELAVPVLRNAVQRMLDCDLLMLKDMLEAKAAPHKIAN